MGAEVSPSPACTLATLPVLFEAAALALIVCLKNILLLQALLLLQQRRNLVLS